MQFWIFDAASWVYIVIYTYLGSQIANLMHEFCDDIHHHELKEIRD